MFIRRLLEWRPHQGALAYSAMPFAAALMHSVFQFYYVKVFVDMYHIPEEWFQVIQVVFLIWNALNDPVLGYCQDHCDWSIVKSRRHTILYGAPLFALSFLVPWFPWREYGHYDWMCGLHLLFALFFYDLMFTYVLLATGCVFTEMSRHHEDRLRLTQYSTVASLIGSSGVFLCEVLSDHLNIYTMFQTTCVIIAVVAWVAMHYAGRNAHTLYELQEIQSQSNTGVVDRSTEYGMLTLTWQILSNGNFFAFVVMNFLSQLHINFIANFCSILSDNIIGTANLPKYVWNIYYGAIPLIPKIFMLFSRPILRHYGYYRMCQWAFILKVVLGVSMFMIGSQHIWVFMVFVLADCLLCGFPSSLFNVITSDIIDEDQKIYDRKHPLSSMVMGTNALITKPAISIAPMVTLYILNQHGYEEFKKGKDGSEISDDLKSTMFLIVCVLPAVIGLVQMLAWSKYRLRDSHRVDAKYVET